RGDLDAIVARSLEALPRDRYTSAQALSEDVRRHLDRLPLDARPVTVRYRTGKLFRRHPVAAPLVSALALALVVLSVYAALLARRSLAERNEARRQRAQAEEVTRFLEAAFRAPDPNLGEGDKIRAKDLLDRETDRVLREFPGRPELRARLLGTLAEVYLNLGLFDEAGALFDRALALRLELYGESSPEVGAIRNGLAWMALQQGRYPEALEQVDKALAALAPGETNDELLRADALERRGMAEVALGRFAEGEADHRRVLAIRRRLLGDGDEAVGAAWSNLAESVGYQGRFQEAEEMARRALQVAETTRGRDSVAGATALSVLGDQRYSTGDLEGAVEAYDESLAIYRRRVSETHPSLAILLNNRARALRGLGDFGPAEESYRQALGIVRSSLGGGHREEATVLGNLAQVLRKRGRFEEAFELTQRAQAIDRELLGLEHVIEGVNLNRLGSILRDWGKLDAAAEAYGRAGATLEALGGAGASSLSYAIAGLARTRLEQGRYDPGRLAEARQLFEEALREVERVAGAGSPRLADARCELGDGLRAAGDWAGAVAEYRRALDALPAAEDSWLERSLAWRRIAEVELLRDRAEAAREAAERALELVTARRPAGHWQLAEVRIVATLADAGARGRPVFQQRIAADLETLERELGADSPATRDALEGVVLWLEAHGSPEAPRYRRRLDELLEHRRRLASEAVALP
ncbi:MAG: tetratricopeptide repeat protein, partial [Acidobacteria bacterium]|nr:tetratricopeptide repeat protein [Acidobacteriota bacterium]